MALGTGSGVPAAELIDFLSTRRRPPGHRQLRAPDRRLRRLVDELLARCPRLRDPRHEPRSARASQRRAGRTRRVRSACAAHASARPPPGGAAVPRPRGARPPDFAMTDRTRRRRRDLPAARRHPAGHRAGRRARPRALAAEQIVDAARRPLPAARPAAAARRCPRQQTLQAALDWSHDLLSDDERVLLRRLAVVRRRLHARGGGGGLRRPRRLDARCGRLVDKSLVAIEDDGVDRRYRLLETVRVYAEERSIEAGENAVARDRHRDHFLAWVEAIAPELHLPRP